MGSIASVLQWHCERCTLINPTERSDCLRCGVARAAESNKRAEKKRIVNWERIEVQPSARKKLVRDSQCSWDVEDHRGPGRWLGGAWSSPGSDVGDKSVSKYKLSSHNSFDDDRLTNNKHSSHW